VAVFCIVGLGNPGTEYQDTRHNIGFMVLDELAIKWKLKFKKGDGPYKFIKYKLRNQNILLATPTTFMNKSGNAVNAIYHKFHIHLSDFLILCDDFNLSLGQLRLRKKGSDGGHNGLASIIQSLKTQTFCRLRFGIGLPDSVNTVDYVLSPFDNSELPVVNEMIEKGAQAVVDFVTRGVDWTMNNYN
jgi:PTH1 family peptidyl-tRNA hydrolase